ncbi:hypothetical protein D088_710027 [Salmonella enterica subsp. houtenae serovar 16:z4,z32:-- str. RKS3027]|nr:hypothetical protein D088_710027 [Salmonella enterica subsp. houtenae serovar 16:z4,z32:-- str. RKS3027]
MSAITPALRSFWKVRFAGQSCFALPDDGVNALSDLQADILSA